MFRSVIQMARVNQYSSRETVRKQRQVAMRYLSDIKKGYYITEREQLSFTVKCKSNLNVNSTS